MAIFELPFYPSGASAPVQVPVLVPNHIHISEQQLLSFQPFLTWMDTLKTSLDLQKEVTHRFHHDRFQLKAIEIQSVDFFGTAERGSVGFVKLNADIRNGKGMRLPGIAFLRGGSLAVLIILRPRDARDERWVVTTIQPRLSSGSLSFVEIPTGQIDGHGTFTGAVAKELKEETGLIIRKSELIDMTRLALEGSQSRENLQMAMYTTPGGSDEFVSIYLWEKVLDRQEIEDLKGKLGGKEEQGAIVAFRLSDYEELWREGARDAKTLAAWALYEALKRSGRIM